MFKFVLILTRNFKKIVIKNLFTLEVTEVYVTLSKKTKVIDFADYQLMTFFELLNIKPGTLKNPHNKIVFKKFKIMHNVICGPLCEKQQSPSYLSRCGVRSADQRTGTQVVFSCSV